MSRTILIPCPGCGGDGIWTDENDEYVCSRCEGEGKVPLEMIVAPEKFE